MCTSFASSANRPNRRRKSSVVPTTQTTSAAATAAPRACWKNSSWSGGNAPRPEPLRKIGSRPFSANSASCFHAPSHQMPLPAITAGRSAAFNNSAAFITSRGSPKLRALERDGRASTSSVSANSTSIGSSR